MAARKSRKRKAISRRSTSVTQGQGKKSPKRTPTKKAGRKARARYSDADRQRILATAKAEGLTANQVKERFGVTPVTYYSWRKKSGTKRRPRGRAAATGAAVGRAVGGIMNVADTIREELRTHIRKILPDLLASELGSAPRGRGRRRRPE